MQTDQAQKLSQLIKTSTVLRDEERQAWLAMLSVMNDKQAADLFGILTSDVRKKVPAQPSLRHIANLPAEMSYHMATTDRSVSQPVAVKTMPSRPPVAPRPTQPRQQPAAPHQDIAQVIKQRVEEKELPAPHTKEPLELSSGHRTHTATRPVATTPPQDPELQTMRAKISEPISAKPVNTHRPSAHTNEYISLDELLAERQDRQHARESAPTVATTDTPTPTRTDQSIPELKKIDDVVQCTTEMLRSHGFQALNEQLVALVHKQGYFAVMLRFEQSQLYQQYIEAGKSWLSGAAPSKTVLAKAEFEQVTDILRNMQVG